MVKPDLNALGAKIGRVIAKAGLGLLALYAIIGGFDNITPPSLPRFSLSAFAESKPDCAIDKERLNNLRAAATGFFAHFRFAEKPFSAAKLSLSDSQSHKLTLDQFQGKVLLVNLWAVWCVPCRSEMPQLAKLQQDLGSDRFSVVAINIDDNETSKVSAFMKSVAADNLALYRDQGMATFNEVQKNGLALGLPVTLLIDRNSCLVGSYNGSAPWASDEAKKLIQAVIDYP